MSTFQRDMTQGSVTKHLIRFSLPFLAANLLQAFYNLADMLIVGIYGGAVGTSAVGTGGLITILVINLISGLAVGGTVMIAQFIGARRQDDVKKTIGTMFTLYAIAAVVLTVVMLIFNKYILVALNTPKESFDEALAYLNICMGGTIFMFGYNAVSAVLRGLGDSRHRNRYEHRFGYYFCRPPQPRGGGCSLGNRYCPSNQLYFVSHVSSLQRFHF